MSGVPVLSGLNLEKMGRAYVPQGQGKLSVLTGCLYLAGVCKAGSDPNYDILFFLFFYRVRFTCY